MGREPRFSPGDVICWKSIPGSQCHKIVLGAGRTNDFYPNHVAQIVLLPDGRIVNLVYQDMNSGLIKL